MICHPHPLYGGDMYNNVVGAIEEGFAAKDFTTLRFNFRGVGGSSGRHGDGEGEVKDVISAVHFLKNFLDPDGAIMLAGYSFGAWVCVKAAAKGEKEDGLFLVSYPFSVYEADLLTSYDRRIYLVGGDRDDIAPATELLKVYKAIPALHKFLKIIPTDHFYYGKEQEITDFIKEQVALPPA